MYRMSGGNDGGCLMDGWMDGLMMDEYMDGRFTIG